VQPAELFVVALAERLTVARHDRAHNGIGLDGAKAPAGELDRP
jgi:hypothetical protein